MKLKIAYFTDTFYPEINGVANTLAKLHQYLENQQIEHIFLLPNIQKRLRKSIYCVLRGYRFHFPQTADWRCLFFIII